MNKLFNILTVALLIAGLAACESLKLGDEGLSKAPETAGATIDTLFAKGEYIKEGGELGAMFWEYRYDDSNRSLIKAVVKALYGKESVL